mgnify:CR=1 FL=1
MLSPSMGIHGSQARSFGDVTRKIISHLLGAPGIDVDNPVGMAAFVKGAIIGLDRDLIKKSLEKGAVVDDKMWRRQNRHTWKCDSGLCNTTHLNLSSWKAKRLSPQLISKILMETHLLMMLLPVGERRSSWSESNFSLNMPVILFSHYATRMVKFCT